jgi:hypothetical protein
LAETRLTALRDDHPPPTELTIAFQVDRWGHKLPGLEDLDFLDLMQVSTLLHVYRVFQKSRLSGIRSLLPAERALIGRIMALTGKDGEKHH